MKIISSGAHVTISSYGRAHTQRSDDVLCIIILMRYETVRNTHYNAVT